MAGIATGPTKKAEGKKDTFSPASSFLELVEYDPQTRTLDITFRSGSKHRYLQCYPATFSSFKDCQNHSVYYARAIKGNLPAVKLIDNTIGRNESAPLKQVKKEHTLDAGLRKQQAGLDRINGTIARAFAAAGL